jgi:hypothetical protein
MRLALIFLAAGLWAAEPPKPIILTDSDKLPIREWQLKLTRIEAAKLAIIAANAPQLLGEEKAANEALTKIVQAWAGKGCVLQDDLTCAAKPEAKK